MPRSPSPEWRRRKEPITDDLILASVNAANGVFHPETGHYSRLRFTGCETKERANEVKQSLYRCAAYLKYSMSATVVPADDGTYTVEFVVINKAHARAHVLARYGTDRSKWPYDPTKRGI